jgi:putative hydrolase of the HAD superfamily
MNDEKRGSIDSADWPGDSQSAIVFDLDDTLIDTSRVFYSIRERFIELLQKLSFSRDAVLQTFDRIDENNIKRFGYISERMLVSMRETYEELTLGTGASFSAAALRAISRSQSGAQYIVPRPMPWSRSLLRWCSRKYTLALVTRGSEALQNAKIERLGIRHFFKVIRIVSRKDVKTFLDTLAMLKCDPHLCTSVGDSVLHDIVPAIDAGMKAIHVRYPMPFVHWQHDSASDLSLEEDFYRTARDLREVKQLLISAEMAPALQPAQAALPGQIVLPACKL